MTAGHHLLRAVAAASLVVLAGCGGGSDASPQPAAAAASAEGFWQGPTSSGDTANLLVLENGAAWSVYATGNAIHGAFYGQASVGGNAMTLSGTDLNLDSSAGATASYSGTVTARTSISLADSPKSLSFAASYQSGYDTPVPISALAGTYAGNLAIGNSVAFAIPMSISSSGALLAAGGESFRCVSQGQVTPRSTGKNVFDVAMTFTGTCLPGDKPQSGIVYFDAGANRVIVFATNSSRDAFVYVGTKQ